MIATRAVPAAATVSVSMMGGPLPVPVPWNSYGGYLDYKNGLVIGANVTGGYQGPGSVNLGSNIYVNGVLWNISLISLDAGTY